MLESLVLSSTESSTLAVMGRPQGCQAVGGQHPPSPILLSCPILSPSEAVLLHLMMKLPHLEAFSSLTGRREQVSEDPRESPCLDPCLGLQSFESWGDLRRGLCLQKTLWNGVTGKGRPPEASCLGFF